MLIAFKLKMALACAAGLAGPLAVAPLLTRRRFAPTTPCAIRPPSSKLQPGTVSYRVAGDFTRAARQVEAPLTLGALQPAAVDHEASGHGRRLPALRRCGRLPRAAAQASNRVADRPAVQISWHDADAYAAWLSRHDRRALSAADRRGMGLCGGQPLQGRHPAGRRQRSLETLARPLRPRIEPRGRDRPRAAAVRPFRRQRARPLPTSSGNVWEWTSTCFVRTSA